jgi:hypothetical protein
MAKATMAKKRKEDSLGEMEQVLERMFKPVSPRPIYIQDLNRRLTNYPTPIPEIAKPRLPQDTVEVILAIFAGTALLVLGVRALIPLLVGLTSYIHIRREKHTNRFGEKDLLY